MSLPHRDSDIPGMDGVIKGKSGISRAQRDFPGGQLFKTLASTAGGLGLIPGWETKVPQAAWHGQKKREDC